MNIKYKRLFSFSINHEFFKDGVIKNISIQPTAKCNQQLRNGKLLFRKLGNSYIVSFKTANDKVNPFIDLGKDLNFKFYITTARSDEFFNITNLDTTEKFTSGNKLHFTNNPVNASTNVAAPEILEHTLVDGALNKLFTYSFTLNTTHTKTKFKLSDSDGNLVSVGKDVDGNDLPTTLNLVRDNEKVFHQQVDLRNKLNGIYTVTIRNDADTTTLKEETVLIDNEATQQGVLGIIDIQYNTATDHIYGDTEHYQLKFSSKSVFWKYYIIKKSNTQNLNNSVIEDSTGAVPPFPAVTFPFVTSTTVKGLPTRVYKSNKVIPMFEQPKLGLKYLLSAGGTEIINHLPNPPFNAVEKENGADLEKEIFVFI